MRRKSIWYWNSSNLPYVVVAGEWASPGKLISPASDSDAGHPGLGGIYVRTPHAMVLFRKIDSDNAEVRVLNLKNFHKTSDLERDVQLQPGDMLYVPRNKIQDISRFVKAFNTGAYMNPCKLFTSDCTVGQQNGFA